MTQIGGAIFLISLLLSSFWKKNYKLKTVSIFAAIYTTTTFAIVPKLAEQFGREKIKHTENVKPTMLLTDILNRNYVNPELNSVLNNIERDLKSDGIIIKYLDANFPFFDGFPLLPHLSHNDGKKLDLSFLYADVKGVPSNKKKSRSGYGSFESPTKNEYNQILKCKNKGYWQYDFSKYLTLGSVNSDLLYSNHRTKKLMISILRNEEIGKVFIEPHLKARMNINDDRIRFHGCQAVRHDDHIHIQLK